MREKIHVQELDSQRGGAYSQRGLFLGRYGIIFGMKN